MMTSEKTHCSKLFREFGE